MKVKVNIVKTRCIIMSEAVTMQSLRMMTVSVIVSEESLVNVRDTHTFGVVCLKNIQSKKL